MEETEKYRYEKTLGGFVYTGSIIQKNIDSLTACAASASETQLELALDAFVKNGDLSRKPVSDE